MKPTHPTPLTAILFFGTTLTASAEFNLGKAIQKGIEISRQPGHSVSPAPPRKFEPRPYPVSQPKPAPVPEPVYQPKPAPVPKPVYQPKPAPVPKPIYQPKPAPVPKPIYQPKPAPVPKPVYQPKPAPVPNPVYESKPVPVPKPIYQPKPAPVPKPVPVPEAPALISPSGMVSVLRGSSISSSTKPVISNRTAQIAPHEMPKGYEVFQMKQGRDRAEGIPSPPAQSTRVKDGRPSPTGERTSPSTSVVASAGNPSPSTPPASLSYRVDANSKLATSSVRFRKGSTDLADEASYHYLQNLSTALRDPSLMGNRFVVEGHASAEGSEYSNFLLSQRRANAIYDFLISQGVSPDRLLSVGHGESQARFRPEDPEYLLAQDRQVMVFKLAD